MSAAGTDAAAALPFSLSPVIQAVPRGAPRAAAVLTLHGAADSNIGDPLE